MKLVVGLRSVLIFSALKTRLSASLTGPEVKPQSRCTKVVSAELLTERREGNSHRMALSGKLF
jgi:hypothetical protein